MNYLVVINVFFIHIYSFSLWPVFVTFTVIVLVWYEYLQSFHILKIV
jgi:hypothetical protein